MIEHLSETPHKRFNPLAREWILVSPHRLKRPWQGKVDEVAPDNRPAYDPKCYLCPGNDRAGGAKNPDYAETFVFTNDFAALLPDASGPAVDETHGLFQARPEPGICRVICFSPRHDLTLAQMDAAGIRRVVDVWAEEYADLGAKPNIGCVQIFENKGAIMGCSNPHPHGQVWATGSLTTEMEKEDASQRDYAAANGGRALLDDYAAREIELGTRVIAANDHWVALVPFWAKWPFEVMVAARGPYRSLLDLDGGARDALAAVLREVTARYDNLFRVSFPYTMGIHQAPTDGGDYDHWRMHFHFYPPLLRSATVQKFMVGFEMLGMPQRDLTPEQAADRLRSLSPTHYRSEVPQ